MERELESEEKPLDILLDCSTKGLASPSFSFKTSISLALESSSLSKASLAASSSSLCHVHGSSEGSESPKAMDFLKIADTDHDHDSVSSFNSSISGTSNPTQSPLTSQHLMKPLSQAAPKKTLHSKFSEPLLASSSSSSLPPQAMTPDHKTPRPKFSVGQFVEGLLKPKRKLQPTSIYPEGEANSLPSQVVSPLTSPPAIDEGGFTMSTVFHIYYSQAKNAQVYKSVLVSQNSTAGDVVKQAMERYGMKFMDAGEFTLFEVIGRWESIANPNLRSLESVLGISGDSPTSSPARSLALGANTKIAPGTSSSGTQTKTAPAMEEFVVCYTRELQSEEQPYILQCYHLVPEGHTRRFELRSKRSENDNQAKNAPLPPATPVFGGTAHRKGNSRSNKPRTFEDSFEFPQAPSAEGATQGAGLMSPAGKLLPSSVPDLSLLDCSSPDSGVELQKDSRVSTKSSITSEQSDNGHATANLSCDLYPIPNSCPFLLNLNPTGSGKEQLAYRLLGNRLALMSLSDTAITAPQTRDDRIELDVPEASHGKVLCCITRELVPGAVRQTSRCLLEPGDSPELHRILLNGQPVFSPTQLQPCDLIQIGEAHMFLFHDLTAQVHSSYSLPRRWKPLSVLQQPSTPSSSSASPNPSTASTPSPRRTGVAITSNGSQPSSPRVRELRVSEERLTAAVSSSSCVVVVENVSTDSYSNPLTSKDLQQSQIGLEETDGDQERSQRTRSNSDSVSSKCILSPITTPYSTSSLKRRRMRGARKLGAFPADRKLIFSYSTSEEDQLLELLITGLNPIDTAFKLAPSFLLAMCIEYSLKCSGSVAASRLACKAVDHIHSAIWVSIHVHIRIIVIQSTTYIHTRTHTHTYICVHA